MLSTLTKLIIANRALRKIGYGKVLITFGESTPAGLAISSCYNTIRDEVLSEHPWSFAQKRASLAKVITGATAANPVVITCVAHGFSNADKVKITGVVGMTELNGNTYLIANKAANTFELQDANSVNINGSAYTAYDSSGFVRKIVTLAFDDDVSIVYDLPSDFIKINYVNNSSALVKIEGNQLLSDTEELKIKYTYANDDPTTYFPSFVNALVSRLAAEICFELSNSVAKARELMEMYLKGDLPNAQSSDSQQGTADDAQQDEWEDARQVGGVGRFKVTSGVWHPID